jgi:O-antigen/teichoic acid export membrane protein
MNMLMKTALWSGDAQKQTAVNIWVALFVIIVASYILIMSDGYIGAAIALVTAESVFLALNIRDSLRKGFPMGRYLAKPVVAGLGMIGAAMAMTYLAGSSMTRVHIATMSLLVYLLVILLSGFVTRSDKALVRNALSRRKS